METINKKLTKRLYRQKQAFKEEVDKGVNKIYDMLHMYADVMSLESLAENKHPKFVFNIEISFERNAVHSVLRHEIQEHDELLVARKSLREIEENIGVSIQI